MLKLSVVIITFNEEKNIGRCLDSIKDIADEIVVLDSGSTDQTKEICLRYGARFFTHRFDGHIEQKNRALTYTSYNHVLSLDADEAIDEVLKNSVLEVKSKFIKQGYYMNRLTNYCGQWVRHSGWYPDRKLRLWDKQKGQWSGINPHDKFELFEGDSQAGYLKGDILHYSYYSVAEHYRQMEYFAEIAARAYKEKGKKAPWFKLWLNPLARFLDHYLLKFGFLDGRAGFVLSRVTAYGTYLKYRKLRALYTAKKT